MINKEKLKRKIIQDLARKNADLLESSSEHSPQTYQNLSDFAQRAPQAERRQVFEASLHPDRIPPDRMEPELQKALAKIQPRERDNVAREFLKQFEQQGISDRALQEQLDLSTHLTHHMTADEVTRLAAYAYHEHPAIFQNVLAEKPAIVKFLSNPLVGAILGAIAMKWLGQKRRKS
jgi:hypothetical protein